MDQTRYLIAIVPPPNISRQISAAQQEYSDPKTMMQPLQPHCTLIHPNALRALSPLHFIPLFKAAAEPCLPITIKLTGFGIFYRSTLHLTVESHEIMELQQKLVELLPAKVRQQFFVGRPFVPHITLAQAKPMRKLNPEQLKKYQQKLALLLPVTFTATHLSYFRWQKPRSYEFIEM